MPDSTLITLESNDGKAAANGQPTDNGKDGGARERESEQHHRQKPENDSNIHRWKRLHVRRKAAERLRHSKGNPPERGEWEPNESPEEVEGYVRYGDLQRVLEIA